MTDPSQSSSRFSSSSAYKLADSDSEFLQRDELRAVRLQLEWFKPELIQQDECIESTIVVFGSARLLEPQAAKAKLAEAEQRTQKQRRQSLGAPSYSSQFFASRQLSQRGANAG